MIDYSAIFRLRLPWSRTINESAFTPVRVKAKDYMRKDSGGEWHASAEEFLIPKWMIEARNQTRMNVALIDSKIERYLETSGQIRVEVPIDARY